MCVQPVQPPRGGAASSTYYIGSDLGQGTSTAVAGKLITGVGYSSLLRIYTLTFIFVWAIYIAATIYRKKEKRK